MHHEADINMEEPRVELRSGDVRGVIEKHEDGFDFFAFRGIPYAEPPVGDLRFQDPIPVKPWSGVKDCTEYGPMCLQYDYYFDITSFSEDCLYLNVFTRSINNKNVSNPVFVVVHGGAYTLGSGDNLYYGPEYLIRKDVTLVTINYRLGVLGFLDLEDEIAPGNQGLKDQLMALQWVQQNIRMFGGDPDNVTVCGTTAGAAAVHYVAQSPLSKGLVHKLICQGAVSDNGWINIRNGKSTAIKLCTLLGKNASDSKEIFNFLKTVDAKQLQKTQEELRLKMDGIPFGPGVDSKSANPIVPVRQDSLTIHIPLLVGCNSGEGIILLYGMSRKDFFQMCNVDFKHLLKYNMKDCLDHYNLTEPQIRRLYYKNEIISEENSDKFVDLTTELCIKEGVHRVARNQAENGSAATYLYLFSYDSPNLFAKAVVGSSNKGCCHLDDFPFLFKMRAFEKLGKEYFKKGTKNYRMMEQVTEMWTNFARYGRPTIGTSELIPVHWLPVSDGTVLRYLNIDEDITMQSTVNLDQKFLSAKNIKI